VTVRVHGAAGGIGTAALQVAKGLGARTVGVGPLAPEVAINHGISGPNLRASGVSHDLRKDQPYDAYPELDFRVITRTELVVPGCRPTVTNPADAVGLPKHVQPAVRERVDDVLMRYSLLLRQQEALEGAVHG
jgi:hypothetical protein